MAQKFFGWRPSLPDPRDFRYVVPKEHLVALPDAVNLQQPPPGAPFDPALDQGALGSCGPNALAGDVHFRLLQERRPAKLASRLFLYYCTRELMGTTGYDSGVDNRSMLKALQQFGYCDEDLWRYDINSFRRRPDNACYEQAATRANAIRYEAVGQDELSMCSCIESKTPIVFGFSVFSSIDSPEVDRTGAIPLPGRRDRAIGGHDVLLTGYDRRIRKFQLRNSWGSWGQNGNGTIDFDYAFDRNLAGDFYRVIDAAGPLPTPPPPPPPPPPSPTPDPRALVCKLLNDVPKGDYILLPAMITGELARQGVDFGKLMQIFLVLMVFMQRGDYSPAAILQLVAQIQAIMNVIPF